jgi:hypothetical protein
MIKTRPPPPPRPPAPRNDELEARLNQSPPKRRDRAELATRRPNVTRELERRKAANPGAQTFDRGAPTAAHARRNARGCARATGLAAGARRPRPAPAMPAPVPASRPAAAPAPASTPLRAAQPATPIARPAQPKPTPQRFEDVMRKAPPIARQYKLAP